MVLLSRPSGDPAYPGVTAGKICPWNNSWK